MGCGMKVASALAAVLLIAAPVAAADVWRSPFLPTTLPEPRPGTTVIQVSVFDGTTWDTEQTLIHPDPTVSVDCGETTPEGAT